MGYPGVPLQKIEPSGNRVIGQLKNPEPPKDANAPSPSASSPSASSPSVPPLEFTREQLEARREAEREEIHRYWRAEHA